MLPLGDVDTDCDLLVVPLSDVLAVALADSLRLHVPLPLAEEEGEHDTVRLWDWVVLEEVDPDSEREKLNDNDSVCDSEGVAEGENDVQLKLIVDVPVPVIDSDVLWLREKLTDVVGVPVALLDPLPESVLVTLTLPVMLVVAVVLAEKLCVNERLAVPDTLGLGLGLAE